MVGHRETSNGKGMASFNIQRSYNQSCQAYITSKYKNQVLEIGSYNHQLRFPKPYQEQDFAFERSRRAINSDT
jgi:hypothetical protein